MKLDRTRSFGQVYGQSDHTYEQDGKWFDHEGKLISEAQDEPEPAKRMGRPPKPKIEEDPQLSAQLKD